jgi:hypothetical protein
MVPESCCGKPDSGAGGFGAFDGCFTEVMFRKGGEKTGIAGMFHDATNSHTLETGKLLAEASCVLTQIGDRSRDFPMIEGE